MSRGFIADGYTRTDGYIEAAPETKSGERFWDALEFAYRPATRTEVVKHDAEVRIALQNEENDADCAVKAEKLACEFVAKKVVGWNLKAIGIHDVKPTAENMGRLHPGLFNRLYRIIRGSETSDKKPDQTEAAPTDEEQQKN